MKKMFLASSNLEGLKDFLPKPYQGLKTAFISTAANTYDDRWFVKKDRETLTNLGLDLVEVDIAGKTKEELSDLLKKVQIVHVTGGNTFYLLEKIRESGFDKLLQRFVENKGIYIGTSAGSIVVGPEISMIAPFDDPKDAPNLKSTKGLGLINLVILPHYGSPKDESAYQQIMADYGDKYDLKLITDNQAIVFEGNKYKIVESNNLE